MALLDDLSITAIAGEQQHEYLHGQITVTTKPFAPEKARLAAHCDFKGKMFSAMVVSEYNSTLLLCMHKESATESIAQLKKYGVFSKIEISENTPLTPVGVCGEVEVSHLKVLFPTLQELHLQVANNEFGQVVCFNDTSLRYLCYLTDNGKQRLLDISDSNQYSTSEKWNLLEIEAGIANIQTATIGQFVPQMLNFQSINAIDFDKGCYMGQEVVARTKFLGKNKRATFLLQANNTQQSTTTAGDNVEIQIGESWRRGGVIVRSAVNENGILNLLAVMPNDTIIGSVARIKGTNIELKVMKMPYEILE